jgi:hypothetical protein
MANSSPWRRAPAGTTSPQHLRVPNTSVHIAVTDHTASPSG